MIRITRSTELFVFVFLIGHNRIGVKAIGFQEVEGYLELGQHFLAMEQYGEALVEFNAALVAGPQNYMAYFKRATVYLALGKPTSALQDLNRVVSLKPDSINARLQRGKVYLKHGKLDESSKDFKWILREDPQHPEAARSQGLVVSLKQDLELVRINIHEKNYLLAIEIITNILQECPWNADLRERRAECFEAIGSINEAISDLRPMVKLRHDNTEGLLKLSKLYYKFGEIEEASNTIRDCLKLDPEHKDCFSHFKEIKKFSSSLKSIRDLIHHGSYTECVAKGQSTLKLTSESKDLHRLVQLQLCPCLNKVGKFWQAIRACTEALKLNADDVDVLCDRAEAYVAADQFHEALQDFNRATQLDLESERAQKGTERAMELRGLPQKTDPYQILGINRKTTNDDIKRAYKYLATQWHPDHFQDPKEKEIAAKKFVGIASAKDFLADPANLDRPAAEWTKSRGGRVPDHAVPGGGSDTFVGRVRHRGNLLPGKVVPKLGGCYVPFGGKEHYDNWNYEVLTNPHGSQLVWLSASDGHVPVGALEGGTTAEGTVLYVGRHLHGGEWVVGKVEPRYRGLYISHADQEHFYSDYEILVVW